MTLFDLDGTLTPPRKKMNKNMLTSLRELAEFSEIGIVTGSDFDYLLEQANRLIRFSEVKYKLHLFPCNGTKYYRPPSNNTQEHENIYNADMRQHIGEETFRELMVYLIGRQSGLRYSDFPLTGHFIDYRGSMINWCPIGREATHKDREQFVCYDGLKKLREEEMRAMEDFLYLHKLKDVLEIKLGGSTSFDIYPSGWDKTYCLKHIESYQPVFVGDRCKPSGNDYELYKYLNSSGHSFETDGPVHTAQIIQEKIIPLIKERIGDD